MIATASPFFHGNFAFPISEVGSEAIFAVVEGKAVRIAVETGFETDGWREIVRPVLGPEKKIILEGMLLVNEGDEVRTQDVSF